LASGIGLASPTVRAVVAQELVKFGSSLAKTRGELRIGNGPSLI